MTAADGNSTGEEIVSNNNNTSERLHNVLHPEIGSGYKSKTVYLIRHAESEENVDMASLFDAAGAIRKFQLPRKQDTKRGLKFVYSCIAGNTDAPLSQHGIRQVWIRLLRCFKFPSKFSKSRHNLFFAWLYLVPVESYGGNAYHRKFS